MSKVQKKIKELEEVLEEVTGETPNIDINFYTSETNINFKKAKKMANNLTLDNPNIRRHIIWENNGTKGIRLYEGVTYERTLTIFFN